MSKAIDQLKQELKDDRQKLKDEAERIEEKAKLVGRLEKLESEKGVGFDEDEDEELKNVVTHSKKDRPKKDQPKREYRRVQNMPKLNNDIIRICRREKYKKKYAPISYDDIATKLNLRDKDVAKGFGIKEGRDVSREVCVHVQTLCKTEQLRWVIGGRCVYVPENKREELKNLKAQLIPDFSKVDSSAYKKIVQVLFKQGQESIRSGSTFTREDLWKECVRQGADLEEKDLVSPFNKLVANYSSWLVSREGKVKSGKFKLHCKSVPKKIQRASDEAQAKLDEMDRTLVG